LLRCRYANLGAVDPTDATKQLWHTISASTDIIVTGQQKGSGHAAVADVVIAGFDPYEVSSSLNHVHTLIHWAVLLYYLSSARLHERTSERFAAVRS
jgi:hypothetical protein